MNGIVALFLVLALCSCSVECQFDSGMSDDRTVIVQLFEWTFNDIKQECKNVLGPQKFGGVVTSPIAEYQIIEHPVNGKIVRPWWERYQPLSWKIISRSGNEQEFAEMVKECNKNGVRIYVDAVINHAVYYAAGGDSGVTEGVGGTSADVRHKDYPGLGFNVTNFHPSCTLDFRNRTSVRICELWGLHDINSTQPYVQDKIAAYLNKLIGLGVAGFRVDAGKHIWPEDLENIYSKLKDVSLNGGKTRMRPYMMIEIIEDVGAVRPEEFYQEEYRHLGAGYDYSFVGKVAEAIRRGTIPFSDVFNYVKNPTYNSKVVQVPGTNHDFQRFEFPSTAIEYSNIDRMHQEMVNAFIATYPRGVPNIFSGYKYNTIDDGPPADESYRILSASNCTNGWTCEHRSKSFIWIMKYFTNPLKDIPLEEWWSEWNNGAVQAAFTRGKEGFAVFNGDANELHHTFNVSLPPGIYCDLVTGYYSKFNKKCMGSLKREVEVKEDGSLSISLPAILRHRYWIPKGGPGREVNEDEPPYLVISVNSMYPEEDFPSHSELSRKIAWAMVCVVIFSVIAFSSVWACKKWHNLK